MIEVKLPLRCDICDGLGYIVVGNIFNKYRQECPKCNGHGAVLRIIELPDDVVVERRKISKKEE